jgi:uncharacterized protein
MLKWQVAELAKYKTEAMPFAETIDVKDELLGTFGDIILDASPLTVEGFAQADREDIIVHAHVVGEIVVPSSRSLTPVQLPLDFDIDEVYLPTEDHADRYEIQDSVILIEGDVIDFVRSVIEFTVLQVPLQVLTEEEKNAPLPTGSGWAVISEDDYQQQVESEPAKTNTPLAGLKDLFPDEDN